MSRRLSIPFALLAAADSYLAATGRGGMRRATKPLLMPILMVGRDRASQHALVLGGLGDIALLGDSEAAFKLGLASFFASHVAWIVALRGRSAGKLRERPLLMVPYVAAWAVLNGYLWPRAGRDRVPVAAYSVVLLATALAALDTGDPAATAGGALFLTSDALIALDRFGDVQLPGHGGLVMATYTSAQALLAQP